MWAYRVPYPNPPEKLAYSDVSFPELSSAMKYFKPWTVDFPERHISYAIVGCKQADLSRCVEEVCKAVDLQTRGQEPPLLVISFTETS